MYVVVVCDITAVDIVCCQAPLQSPHTHTHTHTHKHSAVSSQLSYILTTRTYGLYHLSKHVNKVSDSSHRIVSLHILIVSSDAGQVHHN